MMKKTVLGTAVAGYLLAGLAPAVASDVRPAAVKLATARVQPISAEGAPARTSSPGDKDGHDLLGGGLPGSGMALAALAGVATIAVIIAIASDDDDDGASPS